MEPITVRAKGQEAQNESRKGEKRKRRRTNLFYSFRVVSEQSRVVI